ncbi:MAG TPA: hypothetical protein DDX92_10455 [Flavobacteriales bacterium]|jgi:hypothetical protein|nr:hypothetical protein [Flavobacteriales bacterium]
MKYLVIIFLLLTLSNCDREEIPVEPRPPGDAIIGQVDLRSDYLHQIWFNLSDNQIISTNSKTDWDLSFEITGTEELILLNTAKLMFAARTQEEDILNVMDTVGLDFDWDVSSGNTDSLAITDWKNHDKIWVIDRGIDELGRHLGFAKVTFNLNSDNSIDIQWAELNGLSWNTTIVVEREGIRRSCFSFETGQQIDIEPQSVEWDIVFTQYTFIFDQIEEITPYLVTGVLGNTDRVEAMQVFDKSFEEISRENIDQSRFSKVQDIIGYDWKYYDFDANSYLIEPNRNFVVRTADGVLYKLHFIDFYNDMGEKGNPQFEIARL